MENSPYMLELYADATIAQKGTQSEQKALREQLKSQIDSWGSVYSENHIEGLWYKLGNINLGDGNVRAGIAKFIAEERKLKGGNAGTEWERKFQIIENNIGIAEALDTSRAQETTKITETTAVET